jgi:hypothetical protein
MRLPTPHIPDAKPAQARPGPRAHVHPGAAASSCLAWNWRLGGTSLLLLLTLLLPAAAQKPAPVQVEVQMPAQWPGQDAKPVPVPVTLPVPVTVTVPLPTVGGGPVQVQLPGQVQFQLPGAAPAAAAARGASAAPGVAAVAAPASTPPGVTSTRTARPATVTPAAPAAAPPLEFTPAELPVARVGMRYGPLPLVRNGAGATVFDVAGDLAASGLEVSSAALLHGVPTQAGRYRFTVTIVGVAGVSTPLRQTFLLRVLEPRRARTAPPPTAAAPTPPSPVLVPQSNTEQLPALSVTPRGHGWKITAEDLKALAEAKTLAVAKDEEEGPNGFPGQAPSDTAVAAGTLLQTNLTALLAPMLDVEYPTRETFDAALTSRQRLVCLKLAEDSAKSLRQPLDPGACGRSPPLGLRTPAPAVAKTADAIATAGPVARKPGSTFTGGNEKMLTTEQTLEAVLPKQQREALLRRAERTHELAAAAPLRWNGGGCGCVELEQENFIYGFVPFWQPVAGQVMQVDFSAFTRLGYLGAVLGEDGSVARSPHWNDMHGDGLRAALRHGTELDLVVYGRHWQGLLARSGPLRDDAVRRLAQDLMQMVDTPLTGGAVTLQKVALPGWPRSTHLYSGLTLFFDDTPDDNTPAGEDFQRLLGEIITALVNQMRRNDREYALNLVVPATRLGADGQVRTMNSVRRLLERTGSITVVRRAGPDTAGDDVTGPGTIKTRLLVLLNEPTTETKKDLRAALDRSEALQSHQRKDVLKSLVPVMTYAVTDLPQMLSGEARFQFDADLVYYEWSFGGAALWPVPVAGRGTSDPVQALVLENFRDDTDWWQAQKRPVQALCGWVCPNRVWWRLALNLLLLTGVVSIGLFIWNCKVRGLGWTYVAGLIAGGVVTAVVYGALLTCDPALANLRRGNATLFVVLAVALAGSMALALKLRRKVARP